MKKVFFLIAMFFALTLSAQVKVGDNPTTVHSSAMLQVDSSTKGFLPPRMTNAQMTAIASPAKGLMVYCTDCSPAGLYTYSGSAWNAVGDTSSGGSSSSGGVTASMAIGGTWIWGGPSVTRNIVINITNNSFSTVSWSNVTGDLVLSGNSGVIVGTPSPASTSIVSGGTGSITFQVTGSVGTMNDITATWTKLALTVVGTQAITPGSATFTKPSNNVFVFSANAPGVNVAGTLPTNTTVAIPYTSGVGDYAAYTSPDIAIPSQYCNNGETDWTFAYSYPAGSFAATGNLTATLITKKGATITAWPAFQVTNIATINFNCVSAPLVVNGATLLNTVGIDEGGDAIRGQLTTRAAAYDAATVNNWVPITNAEYNLLATNIPGVGRYMMPNTAANSTAFVGSPSNTFVPSTTYVTSDRLVPINSYVFAFIIRAGDTPSVRFGNSTIRYNSSTVLGTYAVLGNSFIASHTDPVAVNANYAWVLKRATAATTNANTYISFYPTMAPALVGANTAYYTMAAGSVNSMSAGSSAYTYSPMLQVLATTIKSW